MYGYVCLYLCMYACGSRSHWIKDETEVDLGNWFNHVIRATTLLKYQKVTELMQFNNQYCTFNKYIHILVYIFTFSSREYLQVAIHQPKFPSSVNKFLYINNVTMAYVYHCIKTIFTYMKFLLDSHIYTSSIIKLMRVGLDAKVRFLHSKSFVMITSQAQAQFLSISSQA